MAKRLTIPEALFTNDEMTLINRATYKTEKQIRLKSKRKYLHEDPEAWFISNVVTAEHYPKAKTHMPLIMGEFESAYKGDDAPNRIRYLLDLGKRLHAAFYPGFPVTDADLEAPSGDSWCHECDRYNYSFAPDKWCEHRVKEPSERVEFMAWCVRCAQWHVKVIPIGGEVQREAMCPLYGVIAPPKEIVTFDDDMGIVESSGETVEVEI